MGSPSTNRCWIPASGSLSEMSLGGSTQLSISQTSKLCPVLWSFAQRWQSLIPRNSPSSPERATTRRKRRRRHLNRRLKSLRKRRKKRRKRRSLRNLQPLLRRSPIPLRKCPREPLTWKSGRGFIPTMTNPSPLPGSGSTLTTRTTPFGEEITSTTTSSPWCSCPVISSVECSSVWTNSIRMLFHLFVCLARTTTLPSLESGCSRVTSSLSSWMTTGRSTTPATPGGNWRASQMRPRNWLINTGSGSTDEKGKIQPGKNLQVIQPNISFNTSCHQVYLQHTSCCSPLVNQVTSYT